MKTKLSKRILSVVLAALMVVTSVPLMAISAFADASTSDLNVSALDSYAKNLYDEMEAFEDKLQEDVVYADVTTAYAKYVAAQKAFDAYVYGRGTVESVETAASELRAAADAMVVYTGKATGNAIPTFANSSASDMQGYAGVAYKNVLSASTAVQVTSGEAAGVDHHFYYAPDAVLLYDGSGDDIILPVMLSGNGSANANGYKNRWIWSAYPSASNTSQEDNADFYLDQRWKSGNGGDANWNWNWWSVESNGSNSLAEYNYATGAPNTIKNTDSGYVTSGQVPKCKRSGTPGFYKYSLSGNYLYMSNALKYKGTPAEWGQQYTLSWIMTTGGDNNMDYSNVNATVPISVVNYTTLAAKVREHYNFVKGLDLKNYSEGGLANYFEALKNAATYDPNTTISSGPADPYAAVVTAMQALDTAAKEQVENIQNDETWGMGIANQTEYETLRGTMNKLMTTYNKGVNNGYTDESWDGFIALWSQAQNVMTDVVANGYENPGRANTLATQLSAYKLVTNVDKVDTATLELIIDTYETWTNIFTEETATSLRELITEIKTTVWTLGETGEDQYKNDAAKLDDVDQNQNTVDAYVFQLVSAIKALRVSPDALVVTSFGRYSLNSAMAREAEVVDNKDNYGNYSEFQTALNEAADYKDTLANISISFEVTKDRTGKLVVTTNYADVLNNYTVMAANVVEKREGLLPALTNITNGEIMKTVGTETISLENHRNSNGYNHYVNFTYPRSVILFKTTHDDAKFTYGKADLEFKINIDNNTGKDMNALDSITINAKRAGGQINEKTWALGQNAYPTGLSDAEKTSVQDQLSYTVTNADGSNSTFELENFKFASQYNNRKTVYAIDNNGNGITDRTTDLTSILATTNGSGSRQQYGVIPLQPTNKGDASITLTGDMTVTVPGRVKQTLSAETRPEVSYITLSGNYFGATYQWHTQPSGFQYAGWDHLSTVPNGDYVGQEMYSSVMVIDIAYLLDLIKECNAIANDSTNYEPTSWKAFIEALSSANEAIAYTENTSADAVRRTVQNKYDLLWAAYNDLKVPLTFVAKNADGTDKITTVNVLRNYYLNDDLNASEFGATTDYETQLTAATTTVQTYYSDDLSKRYDLKGWSPETDLDAKVTTKTTFTAQYDESPNLADFTKYNEAKDALKTALATAKPVYAADALNNVKTAVEAMTYFAMTTDEQGTIIATQQNAIDTETAAINALVSGLAPAEVSADDAEIYVAAKKSVLDMDVYDVNAVNPEYTVAVTIDGVDYDGLVYDTYTKLDKVVADILNSATKNVYEIKVNGTVAGTAEYGEVVVVDSTGVLHKGVDIDTSYPELTNVAWTYSYAAPSRGAENFTAPKYMLTATSLGFVVKGNTNLTTANAKADEAGYTVKFVTNDGRVFDVQYTTTGKVTMPVAPSYAFYTFTGYDNGMVARQEITVTEDTVVTANYAPLAADTFAITYYNSLSNLYDGVAEIDGESYSYNSLVNLSASDVYCWVAETPILDDAGEIVGDEFTVLAAGSDTYKFYACQNITVVALTEADYKEIIDDGVNEILYDNDGNIVQRTRDELTGIVTYPAPPIAIYAVEDAFEIYNAAGAAEKFSLIGSVAAPEGCKVVETGFLVSTNRAANLLIENVGKDGVNRLKTSKIIADNQFVVNIKTSSNITFKYKAYAIVEMPDGSLNTIYTNVIDGATNF